jgi:pimeloyl-ACP methyl ester carboxylesterase
VPRARVSPSIELEYEVIGTGRPLLLIGGLGSQLISWDDELCWALVGHGYSVIRFDNRDAGLSTALDACGVPDLLGLLLGSGRAPYLLDDMARDALGLLDHLGIQRVDVLGLSLGGMIAQLMALEAPQRLTSVVAALSGPAGRPTEVPAAPVIEALLRPPGVTLEERVDRAVELRRVLAGGARDFDVAAARRRAEAQILRSYLPVGTMRQAAAVLATPSRLPELPRVKTPTMVIHGELDPLAPFASARAAAQAMPNAIFVGLPGLGHDLTLALALTLIEGIADFHARNTTTARQAK